MMKKIYMEKAVASGVLFWEVVVNGTETVCKAGKVGARCNEYPPNAHATPDEANNFFKYLVEQKKRQGFSEVEGSVAKARSAPGRGQNVKRSSNSEPKEVILGVRNAKRKPLNGTKADKPPLLQKQNLKTPGRASPITKRAYSPVPFKPKQSPVSKDSDDLPKKRGKPSEQSEKKPSEKSEKKPTEQSEKEVEQEPEVPKTVKRRGRPRKEDRSTPTKSVERLGKAVKSGRMTKLRKSDTKVVGNSHSEQLGKGVSPVVRARGRPRIKKVEDMDAETLPPPAPEEVDMESEASPPLVSKMSVTNTICDKLSKAQLESQESVDMEEEETIKKWKEWRFDEPEEPPTPTPEVEKKEKAPPEVTSPSVGGREPRKRKMTSKYEIYRQETLGIASPEREPQEPVKPTKPTLVKKASTTAAIRQSLSKTKLTQGPKKKVGRPKKKSESDEEFVPKDSPKAKPTIMKKKPLLKGFGNAKTGRVKSVAQAKLTMIRPKGLKVSPLAGRADGKRILKQNKGIKRRHSLLGKGNSLGSPVKRLSPAQFAARLASSSGQLSTPVKVPMVTPSKLQLTPSRMSMTPAKFVNNANAAPKKEDSMQPVIKRRRVASSSELTIASEFGTVHKPSVDDWPAFIPAPVVWQVPLKKDNEDSNGQTLLVDPDRCYIADDAGTVIEINSNAIPKRTWNFPTPVNCMMEYRFRIYAGCDEGVIYEILADPRQFAKINDFGKILSIDAFSDNIAVSDEKGNVALLDKPTGEVRWRNKSQGEFGWMVVVDATGVYHGHTKGVTKYSINVGSRMYNLSTDDNVLDGVQNKDFLYVSCGPYVAKIDKLYGTISRTYDKAAQYTGLVHSVAVGGGLVYAGGSKIGCYDEICGELVYCFDLPYTTAAIQYFSGRLFSIGTGMFSVIDFSPDNIEKSMDGEAIDPITIIPVPMPEQPAAIAQPEPTPEAAEDKPEPRQGLIKVRQLSMQRQGSLAK